MSELVISGVGVITATATGFSAFKHALTSGLTNFRSLNRAGADLQDATGVPTFPFIGAELSEFTPPPELSRANLRTASLTSQAAALVVAEASIESKLYQLDPTNVGLVVGGSNLQQRHCDRARSRSVGGFAYIRPSYATGFLDSDIAALCSESFGIHGRSWTVGGASASGQMALIAGLEAVASGSLDACIAIGALMDLSHWELSALESAGALGSRAFASDPASACRPFDRRADGFIYGEASAAVVVERRDSALKRGIKPRAVVKAWATGADGNRNPNPTVIGERRVIERCLRMAGLNASDIDYVNPHGTGSALGDRVEIQALREAELFGAKINTTKSLLGHSLTAAGLVELVAILAQMEAGVLHPSLNLDDPIDSEFDWIRHGAMDHRIKNALNLSYGFGGINTAVAISRLT